jgi:hypothetical protein
MFKTSIATRVLWFAVLIALLLASFPTAATAAPTNESGLEGKWAKLVATYNRQSRFHDGANRWVEQWIADNPKASKSKKAELRKALLTSNTAWTAATYIAMRHNGFDTEGNIVDRAAAQKSVKDLSRALQRYSGAIRSVKSLIRQYNLEK